MDARKLQTAQEYLEARRISTIAFVGSMDAEKAMKEIEEERAKGDCGILGLLCRGRHDDLAPDQQHLPHPL